ncbi:MAG TPA: peptidoglycan recognition family protein [Vicinamibacterales bacterium]|nr:peptidoglycan recognition family protein [Vicinamibacterales bacterium]
MISADGWVSFAERRPGPPEKVSPGINTVAGAVLHSAEGYEAAIMSTLATRAASWHFTNLYDGRLWQHYPVSARCWHVGGASFPNNSLVSIEHEGIAGERLTEAQIATSVRVLRDLMAYGGWQPRRPESPFDRTATLYEHRECTRFGAGASACPSGRIPWDEILRRLQAGGEDDMMIPHNAIAQWFEGRRFDEIVSGGVMQVASDLSLPQGARMVRLDVYKDAGGLMFRHPSGLVAGVLEPDERHATIDVEVSPEGTCLFETFGGPAAIRRIGALGYWT